MLTLFCDTHAFQSNAWGQQGGTRALTIPLEVHGRPGSLMTVVAHELASKRPVLVQAVCGRVAPQLTQLLCEARAFLATSAEATFLAQELCIPAVYMAARWFLDDEGAQAVEHLQRWADAAACRHAYRLALERADSVRHTCRAVHGSAIKQARADSQATRLWDHISKTALSPSQMLAYKVTLQSGSAAGSKSTQVCGTRSLLQATAVVQLATLN